MTLVRCPCCKIPADETTIWKYMSFSKFSYLLKEKELYFSKAKMLIDQQEAVVPQLYIEERKRVYSQKPWSDEEDAKSYSKTHQKILGMISDRMYVNCWIDSSAECQLMWEKFCPNGGVALKSSIKSLSNALSLSHHDICYSKVTYIDLAAESYNTQDCDEDVMLPILHKDKAFVFEHEIRLIHQARGWEIEENKNHFVVPVKLDQIIEKIVLSPCSTAKLSKLKAEMNLNGQTSNLVCKSDLDVDAGAQD